MNETNLQEPSEHTKITGADQRHQAIAQRLYVVLEHVYDCMCMYKCVELE